MTDDIHTSTNVFTDLDLPEEAKAVEILRPYTKGQIGSEFFIDDHRGLVSAIASALREAREAEREHILGLLGYDKNGCGIVRAKIWEGREVGITEDPYYNLEGARIDLERKGADKICLKTIERVQEKLCAVSKYAAAIRKKGAQE